MTDSVFPQRPGPPVVEPVPAALVVPATPLAAIRECLAISIHDLVNDAATKRRVVDLYRVTRRVENEGWLRRRIWEAEHEAWVAAHL